MTDNVIGISALQKGFYVRHREMGGCTRRVQMARPCLGPIVERPWLAMLFHLISPPFPAFNDRFSASPDWHFLRAWIESLLIGGCGYSHVSA